MDATLSPPSPRRRRSWAGRPGTLMGLILVLVAGPLLQACSDNNGTTGPTFACTETPLAQGKSGNTRVLPACPTGTAGTVQVVGDGSGSLGVLVLITVSPATIDRGRRASVIVIATSTGGFRLGGQHEVILNTSAGSLDATSGTMTDGVFRTTLFIPCDVADGTGQVTASVAGSASGATAGNFTVVTATENSPCP